MDHRAARPGHPQADGRRRAAAAQSLFDEQDLAEISSPDFPGERLVACRNPVLADERARKREDLLAATEKLLAPIAARVAAGRLSGAAAIGAKVGEVIGKYKMAKHFQVTITDTSLAVERKHDQIDAEARLDGIYVIRTPVPDGDLDPAGSSPPTRTSSTSSATSGTSNPTTWTCGPSSTASRNASRATC